MTISNITGKMKLFTPEEAAHILAHKNPGNRPIRQYTVMGYARDMREGRWHSGVVDAIGFTEDGLLVNGQHRLHAVVKSGVSISFFIAENVPRDAFAFMDIGARRNMADRSSLNKRDAEVVTCLLRVLGGGTSAANNPVEVQNVYAVFCKEIGVFVSGERVSKAAKGATAAMRGALIILARDGGDVVALTDQLVNFVHDDFEKMTPAVARLHKDLCGKTARAATTAREDIFCATVRAYGGRRGNDSDLIAEYRVKFGKMMRD